MHSVPTRIKQHVCIWSVLPPTTTDAHSSRAWSVGTDAPTALYFSIRPHCAFTSSKAALTVNAAQPKLPGKLQYFRGNNTSTLLMFNICPFLLCSRLQCLRCSALTHRSDFVLQLTSACVTLSVISWWGNPHNALTQDHLEDNWTYAVELKNYRGTRGTNEKLELQLIGFTFRLLHSHAAP